MSASASCLSEEPSSIAAEPSALEASRLAPDASTSAPEAAPNTASLDHRWETVGAHVAATAPAEEVAMPEAMGADAGAVAPAEEAAFLAISEDIAMAYAEGMLRRKAALHSAALGPDPPAAAVAAVIPESSGAELGGVALAKEELWKDETERGGMQVEEKANKGGGEGEQRRRRTKEKELRAQLQALVRS